MKIVISALIALCIFGLITSTKNICYSYLRKKSKKNYQL